MIPIVHVLIGTKAQFIKMAPIILELRKRGMEYRLIDTAQHASITNELRSVFDIEEPDYRLSDNTQNISNIVSAVFWYFRILLKHRSPKLLSESVFPGGGVCLIHGDTLSTLLGSQLASRAGLRIGHVEAGLRSFKLFNPFPEEIIRILCMRKADLLFAPSLRASDNLSRMNLAGNVVPTHGNTVADAIRTISKRRPSAPLPTEQFAVATCHRFETLQNRRACVAIVQLINRAAESRKIVFPAHDATLDKLEGYGLLRRLHPNVELTQLKEYPEFVALLEGAVFVLTDGGSIQEECAILGKPCLVLRRSTERNDGLDDKAMLWGFDEDVEKAFFSSLTRGEPTAMRHELSPTSIIVDSLEALDGA